MTHTERIYDVMVIGAGFAGMAASLFAARRGLSVAQAGSTGGIDFSTGYLDLMAVHPVAGGRRWDDPWACIEAMLRDEPRHPYALVPRADIAAAMDGFTDFLASQGLEYVGRANMNVCAPTAAGTVKRTYRLPHSAWNGAEAMAAGAPSLVVDFGGLKGFSGAQFVANRGPSWPGLRTARLAFPGLKGELFPEHMAWALSDPARREELAASLAGHLDGVEYVGFPAVLGLNRPAQVVAHLEELTGRRIFEIPTIPPSIAGPRLRAAFDRGLAPLGVDTLSQRMVTGVRITGDGLMRFGVGRGMTATEVTARAAVLATGRFFGKGLAAGRRGMAEAVFGLPVAQPEERGRWHGPEFFGPSGHAANRAGIETDERLRPLDGGAPVHERLFAAGAILAHHDWARMKCGAGLAIATAYKAVAELARGA